MDRRDNTKSARAIPARPSHRGDHLGRSNRPARLAAQFMAGWYRGLEETFGARSARTQLTHLHDHTGVRKSSACGYAMDTPIQGACLARRMPITRATGWYRRQPPPRDQHEAAPSPPPYSSPPRPRAPPGSPSAVAPPTVTITAAYDSSADGIDLTSLGRQTGAGATAPSPGRISDANETACTINVHAIDAGSSSDRP